MTSVDDFLAIVRDEIGVPITDEDFERALDDVPGWDSVHLLSLLVALERSTGRRLSLPGLLEAPSLRGIYTLAAAP